VFSRSSPFVLSTFHQNLFSSLFFLAPENSLVSSYFVPPKKKKKINWPLHSSNSNFSRWAPYSRFCIIVSIVGAVVLWFVCRIWRLLRLLFACFRFSRLVLSCAFLMCSFSILASFCFGSRSISRSIVLRHPLNLLRHPYNLLRHPYNLLRHPTIWLTTISLPVQLLRHSLNLLRHLQFASAPLQFASAPYNLLDNPNIACLAIPFRPSFRSTCGEFPSSQRLHFGPARRLFLPLPSVALRIFYYVFS